MYIYIIYFSEQSYYVCSHLKEMDVGCFKLSSVTGHRYFRILFLVPIIGDRMRGHACSDKLGLPFSPHSWPVLEAWRHHSGKKVGCFED